MLVGTLPRSDLLEATHVIPVTTWPSYGFDEWVLLAVMFPRWAFDGVLTFFRWRQPELNFCHTLDLPKEKRGW